MNEDQIIGVINSADNFHFAFWLRAISNVPSWMKQSNGTYEVLAGMLDRNIILDKIPEGVFNAFRKVLGKEPTYRKKHAAECDILYAVLRAVWEKVADANIGKTSVLGRIS